MRRKLAILCSLFFLIAFASASVAEEALAVHVDEIRVPQMIGVVQNKHGAPVANVRVEVFRRYDGHVMGDVRTDAEGRFAYPNLKNGKYNVKVHHDGYADFFHVHVTTQQAQPELVLRYKVLKYKLP